jgi:hypothetical protein
MSRCSRTTAFAALSILWCGVSASAETMRCQSVNGNLNCAGSGGVSCQTVDGKKVCVSGHGDVVQSFGGGKSSGGDDAGDAGDEGVDGAPSDPAMRQRLERLDPRGRGFLIQREGTKLHLRSDWLSIDRD